MSHLLRKPTGTHGKVHDITAQSAGWSYVGFGLYRLQPGESAAEVTGDREVILVLVEGKAQITGAGQDFGEMADRMSVFEKTPPHCVYFPADTSWSAVATTACTLAVCTAPAKGAYPARRLGPEGISMLPRGTGANTRFVNNIAMEGRDVAGSLLVTEVFTPQGNWSSYPPHKHDEERIIVHMLVELYARSAEEATEVLEGASRGVIEITSLAEESRPPAHASEESH